MNENQCFVKIEILIFVFTELLKVPVSSAMLTMFSWLTEPQYRALVGLHIYAWQGPASEMNLNNNGLASNNSKTKYEYIYVLSSYEFVAKIQLSLSLTCTGTSDFSQ